MTHEFPAALKAARFDCTQKEFAKELGISPQYLSDLEHGRRLPNPDLVDRIIVTLVLEDHEAGRLIRLAAQSHGWRV